MDRFFWALDERLKKQDVETLWVFPFSSDAYLYTQRNLKLVTLSSENYIVALTDWIKAQHGISLLVTHFISYNTKYSWIWKLGGVRKIVAVDHMSRPVLSKSISQKITYKMKGFINYYSIDKIIAVSGFVKICILNELGVYWDNKTKVVYNGIDTSIFEVKKPVPIKTDSFVVLFFGHLIEEKGVQVLIEAIAMMETSFQERIKLIIAGDGAYRADLENLAKSIGSEILFVGNVPDNFELLKKVDVAVVPSLWQEAFGFTVAEALASGVPVIASGMGGIPEILPDGQAGLLFAPKNPNELKECLIYLMQNPSVVEQMGFFGHSWIRHRFTLDSMVEGHSQILLKEAGI